MAFLDSAGDVRQANKSRRPQPKARRHFIVRWDGRRYVCDCGHRAETATDHELHAKAEHRERANEARRLARSEGLL